MGGDTLADLVRELADDGPDWLLRVIRHQRQIEADELVIGRRKLKGLFARADLSGNAVDLITESPRVSQRRLVKMSGRM
ncbi:MAG: hypothetical protein WBN68_02015 [Sedimenticolaceae bacterium]